MAAPRTIADLFSTEIVTPQLFCREGDDDEARAQPAPPAAANPGPRRTKAGKSSTLLLLNMPTVVLQRISTKLRPHQFRSVSTTCKELHTTLGRMAPGMTAAATRGALELRRFQGSNVRILTRELL